MQEPRAQQIANDTADLNEDATSANSDQEYIYFHSHEKGEFKAFSQFYPSTITEKGVT
jgi:predicted NAD-dependent protein-ADP-ribosyltransferase YbiA (DUF1768 family)